jgi:hypothetical protein
MIMLVHCNFSVGVHSLAYPSRIYVLEDTAYVGNKDELR